MLPVTGKLENWRIIPVGRKQVAFGHIYDDAKGRFKNGAFIQTSQILEVDEGESIRTENSFYVLGKKALDNVDGLV